MTSPDAIRSAFVGKLRAIAALVALLGADDDNVVEYVEEDEGDSFAAIATLRPDQVLVIYQGTLPMTERQLWRHSFSIILRPRGSPAAVFKQIVDGVPTGGGGLSMLYETVVAGVLPMEVPTMSRRVIPVGENSSFDYWEITTAFIEM